MPNNPIAQRAAKIIRQNTAPSRSHLTGLRGSHILAEETFTDRSKNAQACSTCALLAILGNRIMCQAGLSYSELTGQIRAGKVWNEVKCEGYLPLADEYPLTVVDITPQGDVLGYGAVAPEFPPESSEV